MNNKIIILSITSYYNGHHYYGSLHSSNKKIELKHKVTKENEPSLSMKDYKYKLGTMTERFICPIQIRKIAIKQWKKFFPNTLLLLEGSPCIADPQKCLSGPTLLKNEINKLWKKCEKIGGYEGNYTEMSKLSDKYTQLLKNNKLRA